MSIIKNVYEGLLEHVLTKEVTEDIFKGIAFCGVCSVLLSRVKEIGPSWYGLIVFIVFVVLTTLAMAYVALHVGFPLSESIKNYILRYHQKSVSLEKLRIICVSVYMTVCLAFMVSIYGLPFLKS